MGAPQVAARLTWQGDLRFQTTAEGSTLVLDGTGAAGVSPVFALACSLAGCMAMDVVAILQKGRHPVRAVEVDLEAHRAETHPKRLVAVRLSFRVSGEVPADAVARAITLSREKYCPVSASLREDIVFQTAFEVTP
ncbi:MAG: OsmC family protein [Acidobacteriota bacterium]